MSVNVTYDLHIAKVSRRLDDVNATLSQKHTAKAVVRVSSASINYTHSFEQKMPHPTNLLTLEDNAKANLKAWASDYLNSLPHQQWFVSKVDIKKNEDGSLEACAVFDSGYPHLAKLSVIVNPHQTADTAEAEALVSVRQFLNDVSRLP